MAFSYMNLWKVLAKKNMTKEDLKKATGMSYVLTSVLK